MEEEVFMMQIGDLITLKDLKVNAYLSAEGILLEDIYAAGTSEYFDDNVFQVVLKREYSASRELDDFLATLREHPEIANDNNSLKYKAALERGRDNENILNESYLAQKMCAPVVFGDIIQLQHVKSSKFLTVIPDLLAKVERENLSVCLSSQGSSNSWLQMMPRYKIDREGDPIKSGTEVLLRVAERANEFIHFADKEPAPGNNREVNCSLENTSLSIQIFQSSAKSQDPKILLASNVVQIHDPETQSNLTIPVKGEGGGDDEEDGDEEEALDADVGAAIAEAHEYEDVITVKAKGDFINTNSLWIMELPDNEVGGPVVWRTDQVRFRHLNSGQYLMMDRTRDPPVLHFTDDLNSPDTLFGMNQSVKTVQELLNNKSVQLSSNGEWLKRGDVHDTLDGFTITTTQDMNENVNLLLVRLDESKTGPGEVEKSNEPLDLNVTLASRDYFRKFQALTVIPDGDQTDTIWPSASRADIDFYEFMCQKLALFLQGYPISAELDGLVNLSNATLRRKRQGIFRQQGVIQIMLVLINDLIPMSKMFETLAAENKKKKGLSDNYLSLSKITTKVLSNVLTVLYEVIKDHPDNQMYVADFLPVLLAHLNNQPLAGRCVTEMLGNNMELQETKIGTREIGIFVEKLRKSGMNKMYLELLRSCCSCQGKGVDGNQCKVADMVLGDINDIIVQVHADNSKREATPWGVGGLYIPAAAIAGQKIFGEDLLHKGLPTLALSWTTTTIELSPLGLFGKLSVPITELYRAADATVVDGADWLANPGRAKKAEGASSQQKDAITQYFVSEMYLGAEMCLDRNYVAMHKLDPLFPYEVLVTMLKLEVEPELKAAAVRLLLCLHIDRDPQSVSKIPCLTRAWSEVCSEDEIQLPYVEDVRRSQFCLVQDIIADHLKGMRDARWTLLSQQMLQLMNQMVRFNFYGTSERIRDVIDPLLAALDRRRMTIEEVKEKKDQSAQSADNGPETYLKKEGEEEEEPEHEGKKEEGEEEKEEVPLVQRTLDFMESTKVLLGVLFLVLVATVLLVLEQPGVDVVSGGVYSTLWYVNLSIYCVFVVEFVLRCSCFYAISGVLMEYIQQPFNALDLVVIVVDSIFLLMDIFVNEIEGAGFAKSLRIMRAFRFARMLRVARVLDKLAENLTQTYDDYVPPLRYIASPVHEIKTMVEAVEILAYVQNIVDDRNLSIFLRKFQHWESGKDKRGPAKIFDDVISQCGELAMGGAELNDIFIDVLMFNDSNLVQGALDIIVATNSVRKRLLENAASVQLLVSNKRERQFKLIDSMLCQLERNAETQELWGCLEKPEDRQQSKQTYDIIYELIDACRNRREILEFDEEYVPDKEIQNLLRNLGCFDICFKVFDLMETIEEEPDGSLEEEHQNTKDIVKLCSELMYWFLLDNADNQELAFDELDFFLEQLDDEINFHHIVKAIFKNNEKLMRLCSHSHLEDMVERILKNGKRPEYLSIMTAISHVGELNIKQNQFEIVKQLASPSALPKLKCFLCPTDHIDYLEKVGLMEPFANVRDVKMDELPSKLAYHLVFMEVLSGCTVGRLNITTVEAKVQSIFDFRYILDAILDERSILIAKVRMGLYFFNAVVEVEMLIPGLESSPKMWALLETAPQIFSNAKDELRLVEKYGWEYEGVSRQRIEYLMVMIYIVGGFFDRYYNPNVFKLDDAAVKAALPDQVAMTLPQGEALITSMYEKLKDIYDMDCLKLSKDHKASMHMALVRLNKAPRKVIVASVDASHEKEVVNDDDNQGVTREEKVHGSYEEFLGALNEDEAIQKDLSTEAMNFIHSMEALPFIKQKADSDVRYEPFIKKLVSHVRSRLTVVNGENRLDAQCTKSTTWLIGALTTMIENTWGMTIDERDDEGGPEEDEASAPVVAAFDACGVTTLCLDLISIGIDQELQYECVKLCTALLFKEGGAKDVQTTMFEHLNSNPSDLFFRQVKVTFQKVIEEHKWHGTVILEDGEEPELSEEHRIIRFMQLMCEGHYEPNQDIFREQPNNHESFNLLDDMVQMASLLSRQPCQTSTEACTKVCDTILEVIQGPCTKNQSHFALQTELIETLNRLMRSKTINDCDENAEINLKKLAIDIFQGLLEGQGAKSPVYERVLSVIHLDIIQILADTEGDAGDPSTELQDPENEEDMFLLRTECLVLLQMLFDYRPSLRDELGVEELDELPDGVACVEVLWRGELQRRFFHIPDLCDNLAKASMDKLVDNVDRNNQEDKLLDFLSRCHELHLEMLHQQTLNEKGLNRFFSNQVLNQVTWITFGLTICINALFLGFYTWDKGDEQVERHGMGDDTPGMHHQARLAVTVLNICQSVSAFYVVVLTLVVRTPVKFQLLTSDEHGMAEWQAAIGAMLDPELLYYVGFFAICLCGIFVDNGRGGGDFFLPFLLLDIIKKNSTTSDVLKAVVIPRKQLGMTMVLGGFVLYIFAFFIFYYFRNMIDIDDDGADEDRIDFCANLFDCFLTVTSYGMRNPEGMGGFMDHNLDERWILDFLYFVVVLIVLLNVIFGIIIDTFSDLRSKKEEKIADTVGICFICGIDKQVFDRASDKPNGFQEHIKKDHNMWAYLKFIVFIWEQDKDDDDGMELYVRKCIEDKDIGWFPMNKAMRLDADEDDGEELINAVKGELEGVQTSLAEKLDLLKTEMSGSLEQLSVAVQAIGGGRVTGRGGRTRGGAQSVTSASLGDLSIVDSGSANQSHIQIQEISGVNLPSDALSESSISITSDLGSIAVSADRVSGSKILFAPEAYPIDGSVTLTFQVGAISGELALSANDMKVQGAGETRIMKTFPLEGQQALAKIVIVVTRA